MSEQDTGRMGRLSDEEEAAEPSSTTDGPAAEGELDPRQGSPGKPHPVGEDFPNEAVRYDDPNRRRDPDAEE
ncbi:MAG TPA: hypothetical protein VFG72_09685 [Marmoricola sp.]|nr:hypothetical protein [Marmoricola sp.]